MIKRKLLCSVLMAALVFSFTGCGSEKNNSNSEKGNSQTTMQS